MARSRRDKAPQRPIQEPPAPLRQPTLGWHVSIHQGPPEQAVFWQLGRKQGKKYGLSTKTARIPSHGQQKSHPILPVKREERSCLMEKEDRSSYGIQALRSG